MAKLIDRIDEIGKYILEGLTPEEACILVGFPPRDLKELLERNVAIKTMLGKKRIEFKLKHLRNINAKSNEKNSVWLLEKLMPEQFAQTKRANEVPVDVVASIIREIQKDDNHLIVQEAEIVPSALASQRRIESPQTSAGVGSILD